MTYAHKSFSGMQGAGLKLWVDILPIFDIEATYNPPVGLLRRFPCTSATRTGSCSANSRWSLNSTAFRSAGDPEVRAMNGDLRVTYPITSIPIIRPYIGGGITPYLEHPVLSWISS